MSSALSALRSLSRNIPCAPAVFVLLLSAPCLHAQPAASATTALPISNPTFAASADPDAPVKDWVFESIKLEVYEETASVKVIVVPKL